MSYKAAAIKEAYLAPGNAVFPLTGIGAFGLGYKESATFKISNFNEIKTKQNRVYPSLTNFQAQIKTEQMSYALMSFIFGAAAASDITAKFVTSGISKATDFTASGGIFTFEDAKSMGVDFELLLSPKERSLTVTLEKAFRIADATAIITASTTDTLSGTLHIPALDAANTVKGYITPSFGSITIAEDRLNDWKISIKTKSTKNSFNKSMVNGIDVDIMGVMDGVDPAEINTFLASSFAPDLTISVGVDVPYNIVLKAGGLTQMGEVEIDDDKRTGTVHFTGQYDIEFADLTGGNVTLKSQL